MKASIVREFGAGFELTNLDIAAPLGREVLVDVRASGLCHSDITAATRPVMGSQPPMVLGHEAAGVVSAVGPDVSDVAVGDHVVACLVRFCGTCRPCAQGRTTLCLSPSFTDRPGMQPPRLSENGKPVTQGLSVGGFAQQILVHENQVARIPHEMPWPQAALLGCGVVTGAGAVLNTAAVRSGDTVVVIGAGGVGLNAVNGAVTAEAETIVAIDIADEKLDLARRFGATHLVNSGRVDAVDAVRAIASAGADAVFDFVGVPAVTQDALRMVAPGGGLYLAGLADPTAAITVSSAEMLSMKRHIVGVFMGDTDLKRDIPRYARLYLEGRLELDALVSREISLADVQAGYGLLTDPSIARVVITDFS